MLQYFPTPYPDELWYSVLCRYHIRNGNYNLLMARNRSQCPVQLFFPDSSISETISQLPEGLFSVRDIALNHTLLPYFSRMYTQERKQELVNSLYSSTMENSNPEWRVIARSMPKLKYCPECISEDQGRYGESYWHREHQIPHMPICRKHGCRLKEYNRKSRREFADGPILPEFVADKTETEYFMQPYEKPLSEMLYAYLILPLEAGPTNGYSNLFYGLEQEYQHIKSNRVITLDTNKLYADILSFYGDKITKSFFGKSMPKYVPMKLRNWEFTTPERYALLAAMIGQPPEITFGESQRVSYEKEPVRVRELRFPTIRQKAVMMNIAQQRAVNM
ncbi:hypothetical protein DXC92_01535 [Clostridiales bacterium TF09-2AC]|nr:hypothetical protein DXC92_01535 [Clostridiales bacterium TF09-2AC]